MERKTKGMGPGMGMMKEMMEGMGGMPPIMEK
jgi:hypothetical protein